MKQFLARLWAHPLHPHQYGLWEMALRVQKGPYGTTHDEVQRRRCGACGYWQQDDLNPAKQTQALCDVRTQRSETAARIAGPADARRSPAPTPPPASAA